MVHIRDPSAFEPEARGLSLAQGQPGLCGEFQASLSPPPNKQKHKAGDYSLMLEYLPSTREAWGLHPDAPTKKEKQT